MQVETGTKVDWHHTISGSYGGDGATPAIVLRVSKKGRVLVGTMRKNYRGKWEPKKSWARREDLKARQMPHGELDARDWAELQK